MGHVGGSIVGLRLSTFSKTVPPGSRLDSGAGAGVGGALMADFERKSAVDVHAGLQPVAGWPFDAGSRGGLPAITLSWSLCGPPGRGPGGQSLAATPRENFVAWATV